MNKKHNRLLDSSKIQQESLHKKKDKRDDASGNVGENINSEFHHEKVKFQIWNKNPFWGVQILETRLSYSDVAVKAKKDEGGGAS